MQTKKQNYIQNLLLIQDQTGPILFPENFDYVTGAPHISSHSIGNYGEKRNVNQNQDPYSEANNMHNMYISNNNNNKDQDPQFSSRNSQIINFDPKQKLDFNG
jgi:hypothetical protein